MIWLVIVYSFKLLNSETPYQKAFNYNYNWEKVVFCFSLTETDRNYNYTKTENHLFLLITKYFFMWGFGVL